MKCNRPHLSPRPVAVRLSSVVHATEDPEKVFSAISNVLPKGFPRSLEVIKTKGHFGNQITIYRISWKNPSQAAIFLKHVLGQLSIIAKQKLAGELDERLDPSGVLHLRFDKQAAVSGVLMLLDGDPIKVELMFELKGATEDTLRESVLSELQTILAKS